MNYRVQDLDRLLKQLRAEGVLVSRESSESSYGKFGWAEDPERNRMELWEPPRRYKASDRHVSTE